MAIEGKQPDQLKEAAAFWDREVINPTHVSWMAHPAVRRYINSSISGDPGCWPIDWLVRTFPGLHVSSALSVGCGTGALERDLLSRGICESMVAFDGSQVSIDIACSEAQNAGLAHRVTYYVADFNKPRLPVSAYDAVFFHQSAHHVAKLEKLFRAVLRALKPGGMLYLDEFVGPSRSDWNDERVGVLRTVNALLPPEVRLHDELPLPIQCDDPSEAIRSSEILEQVGLGFEIEHLRGYGGNILSVLFEAMRNPGDDLVDQLIAAEQEILRAGEPPFHAVIVARPKGGVRKALASVRYLIEPKVSLRNAVAGARYFAEPKLKRLVRRVRRRVG